MMKVLLINPPQDNMISTCLPRYVEEESGSYPPLGLMYIASSLLKKTDATVEILDAKLYKMSLSDLKVEIEKRQPAIVGISSTTFTLIDVINTAKIAKEVNPDIHVCIGGPHTSIYPYETLKMPEVDSIVIGEGEETFVELVQKKSKNQNLVGIKGLMFKTKNNEIIDNGRREFIKNLDDIPFPARSLVDYKKYHSIIGERSLFTTMMSSRGCPYNCLYCYHAFGRRYRFHSVNYVLNEIKECMDLGINEFWFFDDNFIMDLQRAIDFCDALISEKLKISWHIRSRIDLIDAVLAKKLRLAGCKRISFGIESGTSKVLKILRKEVDLDEVIEKISMLKSLGFEIYLDFMIGSPGETEEDILQTISFAMKLDPDYVQFAITTPYPNTDLYRLGFERGVFKNDYWKEFAANPTKEFQPMLINEYLSREELNNFLDLAYRKFYFRPKYVVKSLFRLKSISDLVYKMRAAIKVFLRVFNFSVCKT